MKRGKRFLIGLMAAGLTFGSLMAFVGKPHTNYHGFRDHRDCSVQHGRHEVKADSLKSK